jgi:hypothetical protein
LLGVFHSCRFRHETEAGPGVQGMQHCGSIGALGRGGDHHRGARSLELTAWSAQRSAAALCALFRDNMVSMLLSACLRFRCLSDAFHLGLRVPILKKSHLNPKDASNYRPITISSIVLKQLEMYATVYSIVVPGPLSKVEIGLNSQELCH